MKLAAIALTALATATMASAATISVERDAGAFALANPGSVLVSDFGGGDVSSPLFGTPAIDGTFRLNNDRVQRVAGDDATAEPQFTTFNFSQDITAASLTISGFGGSEEATLSLSNGASVVISGASNGFFGFSSDMGFNAFTFADSGSGARFNIDDLSVVTAAAVPLPASLPMLLGALGLAGWASRRRRGA